MTGRAYWVRFASMVALTATVLLVLDFGYGVPWLVRAPIAALAAGGYMSLTEMAWARWQERARRKRLTQDASDD